MTFKILIFRYICFAVLATIANLIAQRVVLGFDNTAQGFIFAIAFGTFIGLVTKYLLDKRWIFHDKSVGLRMHSHKFTLYTAMGIITTAIFWGMETVFWLVWKTDFMRELGAILGLSIGYIIKFNLDRKFVFIDNQNKDRSIL